MPCITTGATLDHCIVTRIWLSPWIRRSATLSWAPTPITSICGLWMVPASGTVPFSCKACWSSPCTMVATDVDNATSSCSAGEEGFCHQCHCLPSILPPSSPTRKKILSQSRWTYRTLASWNCWVTPATLCMLSLLVWPSILTLLQLVPML